MTYIDQSYQVTFTTDPGVYKYRHLGTAAGTVAVQTQPCLLGYIQINTGALGTIIVFDAASTAGTSATNLIGSVPISSVSGSAPMFPPLFPKLATKTGLVIINSANLDLTVASLP